MMLDRLAGNETMRRDLAAALASGRLAHGVLLCGEKGLGAGFAARCLAADYLYPEGGPAAEAMLAGRSDECMEVRGEGAQGVIRVDQVREIRRMIQSTALTTAGRVVILYDAQMLNLSSANALLKSLEEPPPGVLFVLTAPSPASLLPTIRSRCAVYTLSPVGEEACAALLRRAVPAGADGANLPLSPEQLAVLYAGEIGRALDALQNPARMAVLADALRLAELAAQEQEYLLLTGFAGYEAAKKPKKTAAKKPAGTKRGAAKPAEPETPLPDPLPDPLPLLLHDLACIGSAVLRGQPLCGLSAQKAARLAECSGQTLRALAGNVNRKLALTNLAIRLAQP